MTKKEEQVPVQAERKSQPRDDVDLLRRIKKMLAPANRDARKRILQWLFDELNEEITRGASFFRAWTEEENGEDEGQQKESDS